MTSARDMAKTAVILCAVCIFAGSDGKAVMKKSVGEAQFMNDLGKFLKDEERQKFILALVAMVERGIKAIIKEKKDAKPQEVRSWKVLPDHLQAKMQKKPRDWNKGYRAITFKTKAQ